MYYFATLAGTKDLPFLKGKWIQPNQGTWQNNFYTKRSFDSTCSFASTPCNVYIDVEKTCAYTDHCWNTKAGIMTGSAEAAATSTRSVGTTGPTGATGPTEAAP